MRSSAIHALACVFQHATVHLTLSGSQFGLSLSCMSVCVCVCRLVFCVSPQTEIESLKSTIFQTFSFLLSFLCASCQFLLQPRVSQAPGNLQHGDDGWRKHHNICAQAPEGWSSVLNMQGNLWVSNCWEDGCGALSGF